MPNNNYGFLDRLLHRVALGSDTVAAMTFELESLLFPTDQHRQATHGNPVFVAGLARAGTTLLMRLLHDTGEFCSLTYRDMPFLLAPNLWQKLGGASAQAGAASERAHGDGLLVDFDSPEALEEAFWRVHCGADYIFPTHLSPMVADAEVVEKFRRYIGHILRRHGGNRYLSKNNNNILRLATLRKAFPDAVILVPFRNPLDQATSLLQQHRRFTAMHGEDAFSRSYMGWLVHHEFGGDHRPFNWGTAAGNPGTPDSLDYWLAQWFNAYTALSAQQRDASLGLIFVDYDALCADPQAYWSALAKKTGLRDGLPGGEEVRAQAKKPAPALESAWLDRANLLHQELTQLSSV